MVKEKYVVFDISVIIVDIRGAQRVVEDFTEMVVEARRQIVIIIIIL